MAVQFQICLLIVLVSSQVTLVLGRNDFYQYFFSHHHHRGSSTTEVPASSTTGSSTTEVPSISTTGLSTSEVFLSSTAFGSSTTEVFLSSAAFGGTETRDRKNDTIQRYEPYGNDDFNRSFAVGRIVGIVFGSVVAASFVIGCCCFLCCGACRKPAEQRGFIISSNVQVRPNNNPAQQISYMQQQATTVPYVSQQAPYAQQNQRAPYTHQYQNQAILHHIPPEQQMPEFPPPYDTQAVQPQQNSTVHWQQAPMKEERQFSPVHQQIPTQPLIDLEVTPTAPTGYEKN